MPNQIVKIILRHGTDEQRRAAEGVGVTFSLGEAGYAYDTKRVYIGDGVTPGGTPVSIRNLGAVGTLFGNYAGSGFSQEAWNVLTLSGAETGDLIYDRNTRILYSLSGKSSFPPLTSDLVKYDFTVQLNSNQLEFNGSNQLQIKGEGIVPSLISQACVGTGLIKYDANSPIVLANNGVQNGNLVEMPANTVKANPTDIQASPTDLYCGPRQVIGRTAAGTLSAVNFDSILAESTIRTTNGISVSSVNNNTSILYSLCSNVFRLNEVGGTVSNFNIIPPTIINGALSAVGNFSTSGTVNCAGVTTNNGNVNAGGGSLTCGNIVSLGIYTQNSDINTGTGDVICQDINASGSLAVGGNVVAGGDVVAFNSSDAKLKINVKPIENALANIDLINGYTFTWNEENDNTPRKGEDIGVLAQEIQQVLPQVVVEKDNGYLGVDYQRIIPYLISCIKELKSEIQTLKNEVR